MMQRIIWIVTILLCLFMAGPVPAQDGPTGQAGQERTRERDRSQGNPDRVESIGLLVIPERGANAPRTLAPAPEDNAAPPPPMVIELY